MCEIPFWRLRIRLVGGVEKWEDGKVKGWKRFGFLSCVFGWRSGKVGGRKLFCLVGEKKGKMENVVYIH